MVVGRTYTAMFGDQLIVGKLIETKGDPRWPVLQDEKGMQYTVKLEDVYPWTTYLSNEDFVTNGDSQKEQ